MISLSKKGRKPFSAGLRIRSKGKCERLMTMRYWLIEDTPTYHHRVSSWQDALFGDDDDGVLAGGHWPVNATNQIYISDMINTMKIWYKNVSDVYSLGAMLGKDVAWEQITAISISLHGCIFSTHLFYPSLFSLFFTSKNHSLFTSLDSLQKVGTELLITLSLNGEFDGIVRDMYFVLLYMLYV